MFSIFPIASGGRGRGRGGGRGGGGGGGGRGGRGGGGGGGGGGELLSIFALVDVAEQTRNLPAGCFSVTENYGFSKQPNYHCYLQWFLAF